MQAIAGLQTGPVKQQRTAWAQEVGSFRTSGDTFYFVGCLPYFNVVFHYLDLAPVESAKSILKLLNRMGIEPVISDDERCCGHDALWSGDEATFQKLAQWNLEVITGVRGQDGDLQLPGRIHHLQVSIIPSISAICPSKCCT